MVEVLLDKGVTEREMDSDEKPWKMLIEKRMVSSAGSSHGVTGSDVFVSLRVRTSQMSRD